jgi:hypothetical protein
MKMKSKLLLAVLSALAIVMSSCSGGNKGEATDANADGQHEHAQDETKKAEAGKPQFTVDEVFQTQLSSVFTAYVGMKEAFVSSDAGKVKLEAQKTQGELNKVDMKLVSGPAHTDWMVYQGELDTNLKSIASSSDIEQQRENFSKLSYSLYKAIKAYGLGGTTAYYEFCPMAFNDKGAYWLSDEDKIRNPYFGDKMLTCGSVEETLK